MTRLHLLTGTFCVLCSFYVALLVAFYGLYFFPL